MRGFRVLRPHYREPLQDLAVVPFAGVTSSRPLVHARGSSLGLRLGHSACHAFGCRWPKAEGFGFPRVPEPFGVGRNRLESALSWIPRPNHSLDSSSPSGFDRGVTWRSPSLRRRATANRILRVSPWSLATLGWFGDRGATSDSAVTVATALSVVHRGAPRLGPGRLGFPGRPGPV